MIKLNIIGMIHGHGVKAVNQALSEVAGMDTIADNMLACSDAEIEAASCAARAA